MDRRLRPVVFYLGIILTSELLSFFMAKYYRTNMPVYHLLTPVHFIALGLFFYQNIEHQKIKKAVIILMAATLLFSVVNSSFFQPVDTFPSHVTNLLPLLYIAWAAWLFMQQLELPARENIFKNPVFIVSVAVLWFNIISFLFFLLYDFMAEYKLNLKIISNIHYFSNIVYYLLLCTAMFFSKRK